MQPDDERPADLAIVSPPAARQLALADDLARANEAELRAYAGNTRRAYLADLAHFGAYAAAHGLPTMKHEIAAGAKMRSIQIPMDPIDVDVVRAYLSNAESSGLRFATLERRVAAIKWWHRQRDLPSPTDHPAVGRLLKSFAKDREDKPIRQKERLELDLVGALADAVDTSTSLGKRDRAVLLLGFALGLRRSELAALRREDTVVSTAGLETRVRKSKTDQRAAGRAVAVERLSEPTYCPVAAVELWLNAVSNTSGPLFRSFNIRSAVTINGIGGQDVYRILHRYLPIALRSLGFESARQLGLPAGDVDAYVTRFVEREQAFAIDETGEAERDWFGRQLRRYAAHSMRRGYITAAREVGLPLEMIAEDVGHKNIETTRGYIQSKDAIEDAVTGRIFAPLTRNSTDEKAY
jgi:integrase